MFALKPEVKKIITFKKRYLRIITGREKIIVSRCILFPKKAMENEHYVICLCIIMTVIRNK